MGHTTPTETFDPKGGEKFTSWPICSRLLVLLTVHCRARSHRLRSPIVAMALATLTTSQPYRLGDFSCVTIKTGKATSPHGDISMRLSSSTVLVYSALFRLRAQRTPPSWAPCEFAVHPRANTKEKYRKRGTSHRRCHALTTSI